jgi:hypothetical protein
MANWSDPTRGDYVPRWLLALTIVVLAAFVLL